MQSRIFPRWLFVSYVPSWWNVEWQTAYLQWCVVIVYRFSILWNPSVHVAKRCGILTAPSNSKTTNGAGDTFGTTVTFACNTGYTKMSGSSSRSCTLSSGNSVSWSGAQIVCTSRRYLHVFPLCVVDGICCCCLVNGILVDDCGDLGVPTHGTKTGRVTTYGASLTFSCNPGYKLWGTRVRVCQAGGSWSGSQPACQCETFQPLP